MANEQGNEMVALSFKSAFVDDIEEGRKRRTIRQVRKGGNPVPGKPLQLYTGMRTKGCKKIKDAVCIRVRPVDHRDTPASPLKDAGSMRAMRRPITGGVDPEHYDGDFARADGFDCFGDMAEFFEREYGLPFAGQLIEWR